MLSSGFVESKRPVTVEMSLVSDAKMLIFRVCGRMSEMERAPFSGLLPLIGGFWLGALDRAWVHWVLVAVGMEGLRC